MTRTRVVRTGVTLAGLLLTAATALSFVPSNEWWIRIFDFPRIQVAVLLGVIAGTAALALDTGRWRNRIFIAVMLFALAAQAVRVLPYTPLAGTEVAWDQSCDASARVRLLVVNVQYGNQDSAALLALMRDIDPDMALVLEPGARWESQLRPLERDRPHVVRQPQEDTWGLLLYSRLELIDPEVRFLVDKDIPSVRTRVRLRSGQEVWLYGVHPRPPRPGDDTDERDSELTRVAREIRDRALPAILAGDLNDVAWSRTTSRLQRMSGLRDPRIGRGLFATFPAGLPGLRWPLDHVFVTSDFKLCGLERLPDVGSDHFPLLADIVLRDRR